MTKHRLFPIMHRMLPQILIVFLLVLASACNDNNDTLTNIEGSWVRIHSVTNVPVRITFLEDGTFTWEPIGETELHTPSQGSYTFSNSELVIFDDDDCPGMEGRYAVVVKCDTIEIEPKEDECTPRSTAMTGRWTKE